MPKVDCITTFPFPAQAGIQVRVIGMTTLGPPPARGKEFHQTGFDRTFD